MAKLRAQADADQTNAIQDSLSRETRQLLVQFGRRKAFSGAGGMGAGDLNISSGGALGMPDPFSGRGGGGILGMPSYFGRDAFRGM